MQRGGRINKGSTISVCLVFLYGWTAASIVFSFVYMSISSSYPTSSSFFHHLRGNNNNKGTNILTRLFNHHSIHINTTTTFTSTTLNTPSSMNDDYTLTTQRTKEFVFLLWPLKVNDFSYINYKSFESLLLVYPHAKHRIIIPSEIPFFHYKTNMFFSNNHFLKYSKKGYDVDVLTLIDYEFQLGMRYWKHIKHKLNKFDDIIPFHLTMYLAFHLLYSYGGIYTDFTMLFEQNLSNFHHGFYFNTYCYDYTYTHTNTQEKESPKQLCYTSVILRFHKNAKILLCILQQYDDILFTKCLLNDVIYNGASCIEYALNNCYKKYEILNEFDNKNILEYSSNNNNNIIQFPSIIQSFPVHISSILNKNGVNQYTQLSELSHTLFAHSYAYWLGSYALLPILKTKNINDTLLNIFINNNDNLLIDKDIHINILNNNNNNTTTCAHYKDYTDIIQDYSIANSDLYSKSCTPSLIFPEFMKTYSSYLNYLLTSHPNVLKALDSCYLINNNNKNLSNLFQYRHICYPFIEKDDMYISIASSFSIAIDYFSPQLIHNDNAYSKVIFLVRHPVDRMYAYYIDSYAKNQSIESFEKLTSQGTIEQSKFGILRNILTQNSTNIRNMSDVYEQLIHTFYHTEYNGHSIIDSLFTQSLYIPTILRYIQIYGTKNVVIVTLDSLSSPLFHSALDGSKEKVRGTIQKLYQFAGLPPYDM